jgi:hypothetical protein
LVVEEVKAIDHHQEVCTQAEIDWQLCEITCLTQQPLTNILEKA